MRAISSNGERKDSPLSGDSTDCTYQTDFYGNFQVQQLEYDAAFDFIIVYDEPFPDYITAHNFGVTFASVELSKFTKGNNPLTPDQMYFVAISFSEIFQILQK
jgi:hypothetical protein